MALEESVLKTVEPDPSTVCDINQPILTDKDGKIVQATMKDGTKIDHLTPFFKESERKWVFADSVGKIIAAVQLDNSLVVGFPGQGFEDVKVMNERLTDEALDAATPDQLRDAITWLKTRRNRLEEVIISIANLPR